MTHSFFGGRFGSRLFSAGTGLILLLTVRGTGPTAAEPKPFRAPGTEKMAERLERIAREVNPLENIWQNDLRAKYYADKVAQTQDVRQRLVLQNQLAIELLNAGQTHQAIDAIQTLDRMLQQHDPQFARSSTNRLNLHLLLSIAYLRMGEQDHCLTNHTSESCLLPIRPGGFHKIQRGSRAAIQELTGLLREFPSDSSARWLLNIAYMTLGEYPDKVPQQWLIPPKAFESDYDIKRFPDVTGDLGLDIEKLSGGVIIDDFDNDGDLDLVASSIGLRDQTRYFRNDGDGTFSERTTESGLLGEVGGLNLLQADYNNDGFLDFFILRGAWMSRVGRHPNSLLRNNGNGTFSDVTEEAGLLRFHPTQTAAWFDFNGDGALDLFVGNESDQRSRSRCELFRNNGDGTFTDVTDLCGLRHYGFVKGVVSGDFNNDGRPDLYLSQLGEPNALFRNDGPVTPGLGPKAPWKFTNVARSAGVTEPIDSFPTWFFDFDNDGWLDIFVSGFRFSSVGDTAADYMELPSQGMRPKLYRNRGDGTFADVTKTARLDRVLLTMGSNFGDLDNDGWLDFYLGTGNPDLGTLIPIACFAMPPGSTFRM